jgi:ElaB/YqjD/DUF883 family membrane-anchored ribosome-binding protein
MNTETMVSRDAVEPGQRGTAGRQAHMGNSSKEALMDDLKRVVADAEQLIKEAADCSVEGFAALRGRCESKLVEARAKIDRTSAAVVREARHATDVTHAYVKDNPWKTMGAFAAAGVILGILLRRRSTDSDVGAPTE